MGKTSNAVKDRYRAKNYRRFSIALKRELADAWAAELEKDGISMAAFLRDAAEKYLEKKSEKK
jgi:hypothetical protein